MGSRLGDDRERRIMKMVETEQASQPGYGWQAREETGIF
jgi:hypothetical protein